MGCEELRPGRAPAAAGSTRYPWKGAGRQERTSRPREHDVKDVAIAQVA